MLGLKLICVLVTVLIEIMVRLFKLTMTKAPLCFRSYTGSISTFFTYAAIKWRKGDSYGPFGLWSIFKDDLTSGLLQAPFVV